MFDREKEQQFFGFFHAKRRHHRKFVNRNIKKKIEIFWMDKFTTTTHPPVAFIKIIQPAEC